MYLLTIIFFILILVVKSNIEIRKIFYTLKTNSKKKKQKQQLHL
jgi:hypothetical protein